MDPKKVSSIVVLIFVAHCNGLIHLEKYNIDPLSVTVSGISSGACMATQMHVIHSKDIHGAALFAGAPYFCAQGTSVGALTCMSSPQATIVSGLILETNNLALTNNIDDTSNMDGDPVYIFAGAQDTVVLPENGENINQYYTSFGANIFKEMSIGAEHCQPTLDYGAACDFKGGEYINNCVYNGAFEALNHLYGGTLTPPSPDIVTDGVFDEFDQGDFFTISLPSQSSMDNRGYIYIPNACQDQVTVCKLHLAFHGCDQGREILGTSFAMNTGYIEVAEANNIIMLFPQAVKSVLLLNTQGCWDWWGYTNPLLYMTRSGAQITALFRMIKTLVGLE